MRSYLSLIPISARVRRKQSRMTLLCIALSVFLVTAIFSMTEALIRMETANSVDVAGNWHIWLDGAQEDQAKQLADRPDVAAASWYSVLNLNERLEPTMDKDYFVQGARTALCGVEQPFVTEIMHYFSEGSQVAGADQAILTENARELLGVKVGDAITLNTPAGDYDFVISGFRITGDGKYVGFNGGEGTALLLKEDKVGVFMNIHTFRAILNANHETCGSRFYIRFDEGARLKKVIEEVKSQYGFADDAVNLNTILMAAKGISGNKYIKNVYPLAALLFMMILIAGVMMISSSMNSNVAQRMQFFGMLRCLGASRRQIIHFVRLEALNWCKIAVPIGAALGTMATWVLNAGIKYIIRGDLADISIFIVSPTGILCGAIIGVATVFFAAQSPAKKAAKASPAAAVSGSAGNVKNVKRAVSARFKRVEIALGVHYAVSAKKNLLLMTGSFAFSIILFLCFSVAIQFVNCLMPQKASSPDIDIMSADCSNSLDVSLYEAIGKVEGVAHVLGRRVCFDAAAEIPKAAGSGNLTAGNVDLMSYDDYQLDLLTKDDDLRKGSDVSKVYGDSRHALAIWDRDLPIETGDRVRVGGEELTIAGLLKYNPFTNSGGSDGKITVIVSNETFWRLTGIWDYAIIEAQFAGSSHAKAMAKEQIRKLAGAHEFRDRSGEDEAAKEFYAFIAFGYGFVAIIALIALLNIMNSISMSVSSRIGQYGAMRAVGMSAGQLTRMIAAEAFTYAACGFFTGCAVGLALSKYMYDHMITAHFYYFTWEPPVGQIFLVFAFVFLTAVAAVRAPARRIREMAVTDVINEL